MELIKNQNLYTSTTTTGISSTLAIPLLVLELATCCLLASSHLLILYSCLCRLVRIVNCYI